MDSEWNRAFSMNLRRCQIFGWWYIKSKSFSKRFAYGIYKLFSISWLSIFTLFQLLDLIEASSSLEKFSTNLCGTSVSLVSMVKIFMVLYNRKHVEDLHRSLAKFLYMPNLGLDEVDKEIMKRGAAEILKVTKMFFGLVIPTIFGWSIMPFMDDSKGKRLPLRLWLPINWHCSPAYEVSYVYQVVGLWLFAVAILSQDLVIFGFIIQICCHYEILEKNLKNLDEFCKSGPVANGTKKEKALTQKIKKSIIHHQKILERIEQLQFVYKEVFFTHLGMAVPLLCVIGFNIVNAGKKTGVSTHTVSQIGYVGSSLFDIFFLCFYGERLRQKGLSIAGVIYSSIWYEVGKSPRKLLSVIMVRAQNSPSLFAGTIIPIQLKTFLQILRNSYNILAVMNQAAH